MEAKGSARQNQWKPFTFQRQAHIDYVGGGQAPLGRNLPGYQSEKIAEDKRIGQLLSRWMVNSCPTRRLARWVKSFHRRSSSGVTSWDLAISQSVSPRLTLYRTGLSETLEAPPASAVVLEAPIATRSDRPGSSLARGLRSFHRRSSSGVTAYALAIPQRVSPRLTTWTGDRTGAVGFGATDDTTVRERLAGAEAIGCSVCRFPCGRLSTTPTLSVSSTFMSFSLASWLAFAPWRDAIFPSVSPGLTRYRLPPSLPAARTTSR